MKTSAIILVLCATGLAVLFALRATWRLQRVEEDLNDVALRSATWRTEIDQMERRLRIARDQLAKTVQAPAPELSGTGTTRENGASSAAQKNLDAPPATRRLSPETVIANDPQKMAEYSMHFRESLDFALGGLFKALRFSPEQIERFKDLRLKQEQRRMDLIAATEAKGLDRYGAGYAKLSGQLFNESRKLEAEILGSGPLAQEYLDYRAKGYLRDTTQRLGSIEMYPESPLAAHQVERVTEILANSNQRRDPRNPQKWNWQTYGWAWQDWTAIDWDGAGPQLQSVLTPSQLGMLREFFRPMEASTAYTKRWVELQAEAKKISQQPGG